MWNCNGFPFMHGGWFMGGGPFGLLVQLLLLAVVVYAIVWAVRTWGSGRKSNRDTGDSLEILKTRYARGEITEEEYHRMREILSR